MSNQIAKTSRAKQGEWCRALLLMALLVSFCTPSVLAAPKGDDKITIERADTAVEVKEFDPAKLPDPPPPLEPGEAAVCVYRYQVDADIRYSYREKPGSAKPAKAGEAPVKTWEVSVESMSVRLGLQVTIWLPTNAGKQLTDHEHGHRRLAEAYYARADDIVRGLAGTIVGQKFVTAGVDGPAMIKKKIGAMNSHICDSYLKALNEPCDKAQKMFDDLTAHGTKASPTTDEAVKKVLETVK